MSTKKEASKGAQVLVGACWIIAIAFGAATCYTSTPSDQGSTTAAAAECRTDLQCWGEKHLNAASVRCKAPIENVYESASKWTGGLMGPTFKRYRWHSEDAGIVTYVGDQIQYPIAPETWLPFIYECDYDPASERVLATRATPGRLQ